MLQHQITTPEQVRFHYPVAGLVTRLMAWSVDQLILLALLVAVVLVSMAFGFLWGGVVFMLSKLVLDFGYWTWFELRWSGQTPGKRLFKIRVISASGSRLTLADVMTRTVLRVLDSPLLIPFLGVVGGAVALGDPRQRRLGDLAADTLVVRHTQSRLPRSLLKQRSRVNTFKDQPVLRNRIIVRAIPAERDLMFDLMHRRDDLLPETRELLFQAAAAYFKSRYSLPDDMEYLSDEQTVLNLALVIQDTRFVG